MIFLFPKKVLNVDVFTFSANIYNFTPVVPAAKVLPEWWKKTDNFIHLPSHSVIPKKPTIKGCYGIRNLYAKGLMFRTPVDTDLLIGNNNVQGLAKLDVIPLDNNKYFHHHEDIIFGEFLKQNRYLTLRINLPYLIKTKEDVEWTLLEPFWGSTDSRYRIVTGNTNFKYHHTMAAHMMFQNSIKETYRVSLPMHTPLIHAIAHTEKKVKIHNHLITMDEYTNLNNGSSPGKNYGIPKFFRQMEKENKCPFHWKT
jgi:hypothetical protein